MHEGALWWSCQLRLLFLRWSSACQSNRWPRCTGHGGAAGGHRRSDAVVVCCAVCAVHGESLANPSQLVHASLAHVQISALTFVECPVAVWPARATFLTMLREQRAQALCGMCRLRRTSQVRWSVRCSNGSMMSTAGSVKSAVVDAARKLSLCPLTASACKMQTPTSSISR